MLVLGCSSLKRNQPNNFNVAQRQMILNAENETPMRVFKINNKKDSLVLRMKSTYVKPNSEDVILKRFVDRLFATVRDSMSMGVGIAAPQVGILKNIIWVQRFDKDQFPFEVYLNPKIIHYSKVKLKRREGCLSIPNRRDTLNIRSKVIDVEYDTMQGEHVRESISDFTSIIFQHEIDHLNGILYLDHLEKEINEAN